MKLFSSITLALVLASGASAISYTDVDVDGNEGEPDYQYLSTGRLSSWSKTFDILGAGYDPATMRIVSAVVSFAFADDYDRSSEYVRIIVGGETLWRNQEVDGTHYYAPYSYDWFSKSLGLGLISQLQDGIIDYSVNARSGDFYLKEASLTAQVERLKVPDVGSTIGLLGLGLASLFVLRRQMLKGKVA